MGHRGAIPLGPGRRVVVDDMYKVPQFNQRARLGRADLIPPPLRGGHPVHPLAMGAPRRVDMMPSYALDLPYRNSHDRLRSLDPYTAMDRHRHLDPLDRNTAALRQLSLDDYSRRRRRSEDWNGIDYFQPHRDLYGGGISLSGGCQTASYHNLPFKTKDITIRGKTYAVRKSFLDDCGKFEKDVQGYADKKNDKILPDEVIRHLINIINDTPIGASSVLDLVTLNILANSVGVKSAVKSSLEFLDTFTSRNPPSGNDLVQICASIFLSSKVDDGLMNWIKKYLKDFGTIELTDASGWRGLVRDHPEITVAIETLLGMREKPDDDGLRML